MSIGTHEKEAAYGFRVAHQSLADICHYCGDAATDRDHVQPLAHHEDMCADDSDLEIYCVPACTRCVEELRGAYTLDFTSRRQTLASRVKRWPEAQVLAEWTDEALEELGPNLRSAVQKRTAKEVWVLHAMRYDIFGAPERGGGRQSRTRRVRGV